MPRFRFGAPKRRRRGGRLSEGRSPGFDGATGWLNSEPLTAADLRGRVVLVQFWTFTCINWLRTLPFVRTWAGTYANDGLLVVGVHTPEFPFEHNLGNVRWAVKDMAIAYPVALDNDFTVWDAFANQYWPALYFVDAEGAIRDHHFGEGRYEQSERVIQELLGVDRELASVEGHGAEAEADWDDLESPETYIGHARAERNTDSPTDSLRLNHWMLSGDWTVRGQGAVLKEAGGGIAFRFHARDLHLVLKPGDAPVPFRISLDGEAPGDAHGTDVDQDGNGVVSEGRLYQLIRQNGRIEDRTFEITFLEPGVEAYVFTFG
jgi:thiol-disulfide isomerase/thioredoxin